MAKKSVPVRLQEIRLLDEMNRTSLERNLEMTVDPIVRPTNPWYAQQFWYDVQLYGLREAGIYLKRQFPFPEGGYDQFDSEVEEIIEKVEKMRLRLKYEAAK